MSNHFPLDDKNGTITLVTIAAAIGWGIVKLVTLVVDWLEGDWRPPWRRT